VNEFEGGHGRGEIQWRNSANNNGKGDKSTRVLRIKIEKGEKLVLNGS
jgi:hypothetical protein